jgi:hypothetical protein
VPGAFDKPTETTPGADETVEILEGIRDKTQSASDTRTEDPSEQLQDELVLLAMARGDQPSLPPLDKGERIKLVRVKYEVLSESNVRLWKIKIKGLLMLQKYWKVVENTKVIRLEGKTDLLDLAMEDKQYIKQNLLAITYLIAYISEADAIAVKNAKTSGDIWIYLMEKYEAVNPRRKINLLIQLFAWKMDPKMKVSKAIQDLERLHEEVKDTWGKEYLDKGALMVLFISGLPPEYQVYAEGLRLIRETK